MKSSWVRGLIPHYTINILAITSFRAREVITLVLGPTLQLYLGDSIENTNASLPSLG